MLKSSIAKALYKDKAKMFQKLHKHMYKRQRDEWKSSNDSIRTQNNYTNPSCVFIVVFCCVFLNRSTSIGEFLKRSMN